jgi:Zn-dependent protease with chaperone function
MPDRSSSATPFTSAELASLVESKERGYFVAALIFSVAVYAGIAAAWWFIPTARPAITLYVGIFVAFSVAAHGFMLGRIRGNGVKITTRQFPDLHALIEGHSRRLGMPAPDAFVLQSGGVLNAFATRFLGRNFVVLYSDVVAAAVRGGERAVSFVVGHELGHLRRGHLKYRWLLAPARVVPFLTGAYSRSCEFTCDRYGAALAPDGAIHGLLVLAAGRDLYDRVDPRAFALQGSTEAGFWFGVSEIFATHPHLVHRVAALVQAGQPVPAYSPIEELDRSPQAAT